MSHHWRIAFLPIALLAAFAIAIGGTPAAAQVPEEQALAIERQLLCPQCTNLRLDVCETAVCQDMRKVIRERLAAGDPPDQIIFYFTQRYGDRVLADLPRSGFNLVLFGWVGGAILVAAAGSAAMLLHLRRTAAPAPAATVEVDERWLDDELARDREGSDAGMP